MECKHKTINMAGNHKFYCGQCGTEIKFKRGIMQEVDTRRVVMKNKFPRPREERECRYCKNKCIGNFVDDELKDCINFIPKRISAEEKYLRRMFGRSMI